MARIEIIIKDYADLCKCAGVHPVTKVTVLSEEVRLEFLAKEMFPGAEVVRG